MVVVVVDTASAALLNCMLSTLGVPLGSNTQALHSGEEGPILIFISILISILI